MDGEKIVNMKDPNPDSRGVAGLLRNRWPESIGISGRNASEYAGGTGSL